MADFPVPTKRRVFAGHIDLYDYSHTASGWFFCGWIERRLTEQAGRAILSATFAAAYSSPATSLAFYERDDLGERGLGFIAFLTSSGDARSSKSHGNLIDLTFEARDEIGVLTPTSSLLMEGEPKLPGELMPLLAKAEPFDERDRLKKLLLTLCKYSGTLDLIGYDHALSGYFMLGWAAHPIAEGTSVSATISTLDGAKKQTNALVLAYARTDFASDYTGLLLFVQLPPEALQWPVQITIANNAPTGFPLMSVSHSRRVAPAEIRTAATSALKQASASSEAAQALMRLLGLSIEANQAPPAGLAARAYVDFYGYQASSVGWLFSGWIPLHPELAPRLVETKVTASIKFRSNEAEGLATIAYFYRDDLRDAGIGIALHVSTTARLLGQITHVDLAIGDGLFQLIVGSDTKQFSDTDVARRLRPLIDGALFSTQRTALLGLLDRRGYFGEDTMATVADQALFEIDEAIQCGTKGILLVGWYAARPNAINALRLRSGLTAAPLDLASFLWLERQDVVDAFACKFEFTDNRCGFLAFIPIDLNPEAPTYIEVETARRSLAFKKLPPFRLRGMAAIRHITERIDVQFTEVVPALDKVLGPAIRLLNRERLATPPTITEAIFHTPPPNPKLSVIVPLYGRLDFFEYQVALFSAHPGWRDIELIYVLDDPPRRKQLEHLAESVAARFAIPFRILYLDRNLGFAPANNAALARATGEYVCFLNSDIFPGTQDWPERLVARLEADPTIGAIGPLLLFEDGTVQHEGIEFKPIRSLGDMHFPLHTNKGRRPRPNRGLQKHAEITAAFMIMRRDLATELGGFDPDYAVGDFEDVDLCRKIAAKGLTCAVDHDVALYHLERKSQVGPSNHWRFNLTLYNAWVFHRKWIWPATNGV